MDVLMGIIQNLYKFIGFGVNFMGKNFKTHSKIPEAPSPSFEQLAKQMKINYECLMQHVKKEL